MRPWTGRWQPRPGGRSPRGCGWAYGGSHLVSAWAPGSARPPWEWREAGAAGGRRRHWPSPPPSQRGWDEGGDEEVAPSLIGTWARTFAVYGPGHEATKLHGS